MRLTAAQRARAAGDGRWVGPELTENLHSLPDADKKTLDAFRRITRSAHDPEQATDKA